VARADIRPLDLLAARSNRLGGLLAVQTFSFCSPLPLTSLLPLSLARSLALSLPMVIIAYKIQRIRRVPSVNLSICPSVEVLKPISLLIKLSPRTRRSKNYLGPRIFTFYFYFYVRFRVATAGGPYFLLLLLRPFPRNNCRRRWGRYFLVWMVGE